MLYVKISRDFFVNKITKLRLGVCPNITLTPFVSSTKCVWEVFDPINLQTLKDVSAKLKPSFCPNDIIQPKFLKLIIDSMWVQVWSLLLTSV